MNPWFAALLLALAVTATYLFCVRPMRRGTCGTTSHTKDTAGSKEQELVRLRREVELLRTESRRDDRKR